MQIYKSFMLSTLTKALRLSIAFATLFFVLSVCLSCSSRSIASRNQFSTHLSTLSGVASCLSSDVQFDVSDTVFPLGCFPMGDHLPNSPNNTPVYIRHQVGTIAATNNSASLSSYIQAESLNIASTARQTSTPLSPPLPVCVSWLRALRVIVPILLASFFIFIIYKFRYANT